MENSKVVKRCQICNHSELIPILFLGYLPPVNTMGVINEPPSEKPGYPAQLLYCRQCTLVQLGLVVEAHILFPPDYPYTSSTTKILRENFAELYQESIQFIDLCSKDLVIDVGSNDGNLLSNFKPFHRVLGVTPETIGKLAIEKGIPTIISFFSPDIASKILSEHGKAKVVTATNVFAHMDDVHTVIQSILSILKEDGVFISESHYFPTLVETLQYDTIYHEHLRYYSLKSLNYLMERHGLEIFHAKRIPTHGGSIRVYAARKGKYSVNDSVSGVHHTEEKQALHESALEDFKRNVVISKLELHSLLLNLVRNRARIFGVGAPSRASTLINYTGIDDGMIQCVLEIQGSHKIGKYMPGTRIPVVEESHLYTEQPDFVLLFSWHIADELIPKLKKKGFRGKFIVPLPHPIVKD